MIRRRGAGNIGRTNGRRRRQPTPAQRPGDERKETPISAPPSQPILLIAADPEARARAARAITEGGGEPVLVDNLAAAGDLRAVRFCVLAWRGDEETLMAVTRALRPGAQLVGFAPTMELRLLTRLLADDRCNHLIADDEAGAGWLRVTVAKFVSGDLFGIEKYLAPGAPKQPEVRLIRLRDYQGRTRAIDEVLAYAEEVGVRSKVRSQIGQVCEELLMNALYDAPIDEAGNVLFAEVDIKERLDRLSPRPVSIRYAITDSGFAIAVRDRFGRLDKATILRYIQKCLHSPTQIDRKTYGAGLGLYLVMNAASHVVVNIAPGMATEVVCSFDRKGVRTALRGFSIFVYPGEAIAAQRGR